MSTELVSQVPAIVNRSRAGDQNATALIARVGEEARKGKAKAVAAFEVIREYITSNPAKPFELGAESALVMAPPQEDTLESASTALATVEKPQLSMSESERKKPPLPRGSLDLLLHPDWTALTIVKACQYRFGMPAAAVVLAGAGPITPAGLKQFGEENFQSKEARAVFYWGVNHPELEDWRNLAPQLDAPTRRCLAIGQCFGRAKKIQDVRQKGSAIGVYSDGAGWELGEA